MLAPLEDITVLEIDSYMAAPSAGAVLADMGARVIKVEPLTGDPIRGLSRPPKGDRVANAFKDYDFQFDVDNRGKQSIAIALDQPEGAGIVHTLIKQADIFMCNLLTGRQEKFGLDPETLHTLNPKLVHATLTGYGTEGPDAWRPGYDVTAFFGRSGLYDAMRNGDAGIVPMARPAQGDHTTGLAMVGAILGALRLAEKSGKGQVVETSLYEAAVWTQASDYAVTAMDHAPVRRRARHEEIRISGNRFPCGDGNWIIFNMLPDAAYWSRICICIGRPDLIEDERFANTKARYRNMAELVDLFDATLAAKSRDEWGRIFDEAGLIWGPAMGLHEVPADEQAQAIGLFPQIEHPDLGEYTTVNIPMRFSTAEVRPQGPAPKIGEHTQDILTSAGLDPSEIQTLRDAGIVGGS